jgi:predicted MFS family arabinose efflux permease
MIGTKLYRKKRWVVFILVMYGILALIGAGIAAQAIGRSENPFAGPGFMVIFGAGMFILTLVKSRKPVVIIHGDRLDLN